MLMKTHSEIASKTVHSADSESLYEVPSHNFEQHLFTVYFLVPSVYLLYIARHDPCYEIHVLTSNGRNTRPLQKNTPTLRFMCVLKIRSCLLPVPLLSWYHISGCTAAAANEVPSFAQTGQQVLLLPSCYLIIRSCYHFQIELHNVVKDFPTILQEQICTHTQARSLHQGSYISYLKYTGQATINALFVPVGVVTVRLPNYTASILWSYTNTPCYLGDPAAF